MFDLPNIQREAYEKEYYELVMLLEENKNAYLSFILKGQR